MYLLIDTSRKEEFYIGIVSGAGKITDDKTIASRKKHEEKLLPAIDDLLQEKGRDISNIKGIICVLGPGNFTSLRIGILTANTLSYALTIPSIGFSKRDDITTKIIAQNGARALKKKSGYQLLEPVYGREPHITRPKRRKIA